MTCTAWEKSRQVQRTDRTAIPTRGILLVVCLHRSLKCMPLILYQATPAVSTSSVVWEPAEVRDPGMISEAVCMQSVLIRRPAIGLQHCFTRESPEIFLFV